MRRFAAMTLVGSLVAGGALAAERPARRHLCPEDLPEGAHLPVQADCVAAPVAKPRGDGFRDLGDGVAVKVGGRVSATYGVGR